jgi:hypothetical protein
MKAIKFLNYVLAIGPKGFALVNVKNQTIILTTNSKCNKN